MFNSGLKKEWLSRLEDIQDEYTEQMEKAQQMTIDLFEVRKDAVRQVKLVESLVNTIANTPKEYRVKLNQISIELQEFRDIISLKSEGEIASKISGGMVGTGALAGAGVAALGPTAAMAIATTFGTASTGTAIASLSGAAATNAALAWLGGGAIVAGGGGISAGGALLALAGPIGWAIGATALAGSVLFMGSKNKKIAEEAEENFYKIREQVNYITTTTVEIASTQKLTEEHCISLNQEMMRVAELLKDEKPKMKLLDIIRNFFYKMFGKKNSLMISENMRSYAHFNTDLKNELGALVNNTLALASLIEKKIG